jgi:hypothetical protein
MKKHVLYFVLVYCLTSCLEEQTNPLVVGSCTDKIKNQNEEGVDCGGICGACAKEPAPVTVPCKSNLVNNRFTLNGVNKNILPADIYCRQVSDHFEISVNKDHQDITIAIYITSLPAKPMAIPLVPYYNAAKGYASVKLTDFYSFNSQEGYLYFSTTNGFATAELCSVSLVGSSGTYVISGRFICD